MIKRSHVRQFLAVVDAGSFTQAAARIHLTQPTLSAGIAELERLTGSKLFVRDRRRIRLTEAGGRFLPVARGVERDFRVLDGFNRPVAGEWPDLKLGVLDTLAPGIFQAVLHTLVHEVRLEIVDGRDSDLRSALASGRIHCALTMLRPDEGDAPTIPLYSEPYVMMVQAGHRLAARDEVAPEELASEIMIARRSCEMLTQTSHFFASRGVRPRFAYRSDDDARCLAMVAAGQGMTTAPLTMAVEGTVPIAVHGYDFERRIGLVFDGAAGGHRPAKADVKSLAGHIETLMKASRTKSRPT